MTPRRINHNNASMNPVVGRSPDRPTAPTAGVQFQSCVYSAKPSPRVRRPSVNRVIGSGDPPTTEASDRTLVSAATVLKPLLLPAVFFATLSLGTILQAFELPPELPLWDKKSPDQTIRHDVKEQVRSHKAPPGSPSGLNLAFSFASSPTYSIHRPQNPNGVGLVICPGGGFRDVWMYAVLLRAGVNVELHEGVIR